MLLRRQWEVKKNQLVDSELVVEEADEEELEDEEFSGEVEDVLDLEYARAAETV